MPEPVDPRPTSDDPMDQQLREIADALVAESPPAPDFASVAAPEVSGAADITVSPKRGVTEQDRPGPRWKPRPAILAAAAALVLLGGFVWMQQGGPEKASDSPSVVSSPLNPDAPEPVQSATATVTPTPSTAPAVTPTPFPSPSEAQLAALDDLATVPLGTALAAVVRDDAGVALGDSGQREVFMYDAPWGTPQRLVVDGSFDGPPDVVRLLHPDDSGTPLVFSVVRGGEDDEWIQVRSPIGSIPGAMWVHADDVDLRTRERAVIVRLGDDPVVQVVEDGDLLFEERISTTNTPMGPFPDAAQTWIHGILERPSDGLVDTIEFGTMVPGLPEGLKRVQIRSFASLTSSSRPPGADATMTDLGIIKLASLVSAGTPVWVFTPPGSLSDLADAAPLAAASVDLQVGRPVTPVAIRGLTSIRLLDPEPPVIGSLFLIARDEVGIPIGDTQYSDDVHVIPVYDEPGGEARMLEYRNEIDGVTLPFPLLNPSVFDQPLVLRIVEGLPGDEWLLVQAPTRPKRRTVWVRASEFDFATTTTSIEIDARVGGLLTLFDRGEMLLTSPVVSARDSRPHTFHDTYIDQVFDASALSPVYGNWIATHNTWSNALGTFGGGGLPGQTLHGTNQPALVDQAVSSGGIRVSNETMQEIVDAPGGLLGASIVIYKGSGASNSVDARDFLTEAPWDPAETIDFDPEQIPPAPIPAYS